MTGLVLAVLVLAGLAVNGLRLRSRVPAALPTTTPATTALPAADGGRAWIIARQVTLNDTTRRDAAGYADAEGLELLDLVPGDLPVTAARDLLRAVDPGEYRSSRLAPGRSAGAVMLAADSLLRRAAVEVPGDADPADVAGVAAELRPCAGNAAALAVAPRLRSAKNDLSRRKARLRANGAVVPVYLALDVIPYALIVAALLTSWPWGLAAAAGYCLQPYLIFAGTAIRPRGRHAAALLRPVHDPYVWFRTAAGRWRSAAELRRAAELAAAAAWYRDALAEGTARFTEQRRADCPWCGSAELTTAVRSPDLVQHKPGLFTMDRCGACGHVFQNPRLSLEGLAFYYRDAYDGLGAAGAEAVFGLAGADYRARARMLRPFTTPKAWLDVGTGHAHFCVTAAQTWPDTVFDGLDQGAGIEQAQRRGWIGTAHRGMFPELAGELAGRYDVVSMHHYLEHTRDPFAELDAAARVLPPGGYLLIEVPDPQWPLGRVLGRYWVAWFQPQHQHMMPVSNLTSALAARGLRPVAVERGAAHQANDFVLAALLFFSRLAPDRTMPWSHGSPGAAPPGAVPRLAVPRLAVRWLAALPGAAFRVWRRVAWAAGVPAVAAGLLVDRTLVRFLARRLDRGNAYRVLAQKEDSGDAR